VRPVVAVLARSRDSRGSRDDRGAETTRGKERAGLALDVEGVVLVDGALVSTTRFARSEIDEEMCVRPWSLDN
jgi:hypothetical protein